MISSHKARKITLEHTNKFSYWAKLIKHLLQGIIGWRSKSPKSLQEGNPGEGRAGRLYQHPGSSHTGIPVRFPGRQPQLEKAASLSGIPRMGGEEQQRRKYKQSKAIARGKFMKWQALKNMQHWKITAFISFTGCNALKISCHVKEPDKGRSTYSEMKKIK